MGPFEFGGMNLTVDGERMIVLFWYKRTRNSVIIRFLCKMKEQECSFGNHFHFLCVELEWKLSQIGAVKTDLTKDPRKKHHIQDVMTMTVRGHHRDPDDSDDSD